MRSSDARITFLILAAIIVAVGISLSLPLIQARIATSPDGAFFARVNVPAYSLFIGRMPRQGGDKPAA